MKATEILCRSNITPEEQQEGFKEITSISKAVEDGEIVLGYDYTVKSIRVITGKFGQSAIVDVDEEHTIRLPKYVISMLEQIDGFTLNRDIPIDGMLKIKFYKYFNNTYNKDCYGVEFK